MMISSSARKCEWCGGDFPPTRTVVARFCRDLCQKQSWFSRNPEATQRSKRLYYRNHPEAHKARALRWKTANPERAREMLNRNQNRRQRIATYGYDVGEDPLAHTKDRFRHARVLGYRSGLEVAIAKQLTDAGISFEYETLKIPFTQPVKARSYHPDYVLPNGIVIESKGIFVTADRSKHLLIQAQHPDIDLRFVFSRSATRISKQSRTTYAKWAQTKGFQFADRLIPEEWFREPLNPASLRAIAALQGRPYGA